MLREARDARFERRFTALGRRYDLLPGRHPVPVASWGPRAFRAIWSAQADEPVALAIASDGSRTWWAFEDRVWWEDEDLEASDVLALVRERERRRARRLGRARDALAADGPAGSGPPAADAEIEGVEGRVGRPRRARAGIGLDVRRAVWERDGGRCVACGTGFDLQYDHVIPVALGGGDGPANLQVLCGTCNRAKGASLG